MRIFATTVATLAALAAPAFAQMSASPFAGHWVGNEHCSYGNGPIILDIEPSSDGGLSATMSAAGIGTLHDATFNGDTITMNWTNFISRVTFVGKFVSPERVEGTYHESITGEDCTWFAVNQAPSFASTIPRGAAAMPAPAAATAAPTAGQMAGPPDPLKARADQDRAKLKAHLAVDSRAKAIKQFCEFAPDAAACSARIGQAFDFLTGSAFATLTIASKNTAASLPATEPAAGLPSYYDVYQIYMFITRDPSP